MQRRVLHLSYHKAQERNKIPDIFGFILYEDETEVYRLQATSEVPHETSATRKRSDKLATSCDLPADIGRPYTGSTHCCIGEFLAVLSSEDFARCPKKPQKTGPKGGSEL